MTQAGAPELAVLASPREDMAEACAHIVRESFATVAVEFGLTKENCPTNGAFTQARHLREAWVKGALPFAAMVEGQPVGYFHLEPREGSVAELSKVAVLPRYRHRGIGTMLLQAAAREAALLGASEITIGIIEENARLRAWYERHGYVHTGTRVFAHLPFTVGYMHLVL